MPPYGCLYPGAAAPDTPMSRNGVSVIAEFCLQHKEKPCERS